MARHRPCCARETTLDAADPPKPPVLVAPSYETPPSAGEAPQPATREASAYELGASAFLLSGGPAGGYLGVAPYVFADLGRGVFLRPSLLRT
jgi:hypothetical protein